MTSRFEGDHELRSGLALSIGSEYLEDRVRMARDHISGYKFRSLLLSARFARVDKCVANLTKRAVKAMTSRSLAMNE